MSLFVSVDGVDTGNARIRLTEGIAGLSSAADGSGSVGGIIFDDPSSTMTVVGWKPVAVNEPECTTAPRLFTGYIFERTYRHKADAAHLALAREIDTDMVDQNAVLGLRLITGSDGKRPAETHIQRTDWLLGSSYLSGLITDTGGVYRGNPRPFDEADYRGQYAFDVLADISAPIFQIFFAYWDQSANQVALFFNQPNATTNTSTLTISNVLTDVSRDANGIVSGTCYPPSKDGALRRDPSEVYSHVRMTHKYGSVLATRTSTATAFISRGLQVNNDRIGQASALVMSESLLDRSADEADTITCTVQLPPSKVGLIDAGMRLGVRFSHLPGYETLTYSRVTRRNITQSEGTDQLYDVQLELSTHGLSPQGGGNPGALPFVPASSPVYSQQAAAVANPASSSSQTATITTTATTDNIVAYARVNLSGIGHTLTWPAGFVEVDHAVDGAAHYWSLAIGTGLTTSSVTVTCDTSGECFVLGVIVVAGGQYETGDGNDLTSGIATQPLLTMSPIAGNAAVLVAFQAVNQAVALNTDPASFTQRINTVSNTGGNSTRIAGWTRAVNPTTGTYGGSAVYASAVEGTTGYAIIAGGTSVAIPQQAQWVYNEVPTPPPGGGNRVFFTLFPYASGSLRVFVDNVEQTAAMTESDPTTGKFTLAFDPRANESIKTIYQGR